MKRIPHAQGVGRAVRSVRVAARKSLRGLNKAAAQRMSRGDYATAESLAAKGREIQQFMAEIDALAARWKTTCGSRSKESRAGNTALWKYYQPILQALVQLGGSSRRDALEAAVEPLIAPHLQAGDRELMSRGRERWRVMVRRCRKSLAAEKWIEARHGPAWVITEAGRAAAKRGATGS